MSLIKLIDSRSFFKEDEVTISVLDIGSSKGLIKQASDSRIQEYISQITPEEDKIYVHILAMGAGEVYGANRNADYFPESNLIQCHKTFETSPAHIFRNHVNKNPAIAIGKVVFSIYNQRMHRVEVIAWIDKNKAPDVVERIERGDFPSTSMACKTAYDVCSICGNEAHTRQDYCSHLNTELGKIYPDGRKVVSLNVAPLKFFDMSIVVRPADVTSSVLQKVASEQPFSVDPIIGSAEAAAEEGLLEEGISKQATLRKLSEFIKEIDGGVVIDSSDSAEHLLAKIQDPDHKIIDTLVNFKLTEVLNTMGELGISPSLHFLAELIGRKTLGESGVGIGSLAASVVKHTGAVNMELPKDEEISGEASYALTHALLPYVDTSSLHADYVEKRSYYQATNVGYVGNGPYIEPTAYEKFREKNLTENTEQGNLLKTLHILLSIGASALAAKWYITRVVEQKMREAELARNNGVKIHLVKSASDMRVAYKLAKADMAKVVLGK
jgi:hypothetical protein